jgi:malonyl-CoA O-methyltransferase
MKQGRTCGCQYTGLDPIPDCLALPNLNPVSEDAAVPGLDPVAAHRWRLRATDASPWLHEEVARRMMERLGCFRTLPASWLHWEPLSGGLAAHRALAERLGSAASLLVAHRGQAALAAVHRVCGTSWNPWHRRRARLADADTQVGMLWANMVLHQVDRPLPLLREWHRMVQSDGFLMFSCMGPDSLRELRTVYAREGWPEPSHAWTDMHDWGDMLVHCGFAEPVMDMERITLSYSGAAPLLEELRGLGRNFNVARFPALRGRHWRNTLIDRLERHMPRDADGRLLLTFEIIYGHAFRPEARVRSTGTQTVSVEDMRGMLRRHRT